MPSSSPAEGDQGPCKVTDRKTALLLLLLVLVPRLAGHKQPMCFIFMAFIVLLHAVPEGTQDAIGSEQVQVKNNLMHIH